MAAKNVHVDRAQTAYVRYVGLQAQVDQMENEAIVRRGGQTWSASLDLRDNQRYRILVADRNVALMRVGVECGMAQLLKDFG